MNLIPNPSFETDLANQTFAQDGTGPTRERSALAAHDEAYGLRWVIGTTPGPTPYTQQATGKAPVGGVTYTFSLWVRGVGTAIGRTVRTFLIVTGGVQGEQWGGLLEHTLTGEWQLLRSTYTIAQADRTNLYGRLQYTSGQAAAGDELYMDGWQIEEGVTGAGAAEATGGTAGAATLDVLAAGAAEATGGTSAAGENYGVIALAGVYDTTTRQLVGKLDADVVALSGCVRYEPGGFGR